MSKRRRRNQRPGKATQNTSRGGKPPAKESVPNTPAVAQGMPSGSETGTKASVSTAASGRAHIVSKAVGNVLGWTLLLAGLFFMVLVLCLYFAGVIESREEDRIKILSQIYSAAGRPSFSDEQKDEIITRRAQANLIRGIVFTGLPALLGLSLLVKYGNRQAPVNQTSQTGEAPTRPARTNKREISWIKRRPILGIFVPALVAGVVTWIYLQVSENSAERALRNNTTVKSPASDEPWAKDKPEVRAALIEFEDALQSYEQLVEEVEREGPLANAPAQRAQVRLMKATNELRKVARRVSPSSRGKLKSMQKRVQNVVQNHMRALLGTFPTKK